MNQDELLKIIQKGESKTIEFKEDFDKETIETASAFANTRGGTILIGIQNGSFAKRYLFKVLYICQIIFLIA